jgi:hypothetical protein
MQQEKIGEDAVSLSPLMSDHGIREASFSDRTININAIICESRVLQKRVFPVLVAIFTLGKSSI